MEKIRIGMSHEMPEKRQRDKERLLSEIVPDTEGLNLARIDSYFESLKLPTAERVVFNTDQLDKVKSLLKGIGLSPELVGGETIATFLNPFNIILVIRDHKLEELNGASYTESLIVHEAAHSTSQYDTHVSYFNPVTARVLIEKPRCGFHLMDGKTQWGVFLEEGFADFLRGDYRSRVISREEQQQFIASLGIKGDYNLEATVGMTLRDPGESRFRVPLKYLTIDETGSPILLSSSLAAVAVEEITKRDPDFVSNLKLARKSVEGLRSVAQSLDKISPGLYPFLQRLQYDPEDFDIGFKEIMNRLSQEGTGVAAGA